MALERLSERAKWWSGIAVVPGLMANAADLVTVTAAINLAGLAVPIVLMQIYDRIIPNQAVSTLAWLVVGCTVAVLIEGALRWGRGIMVAWAGARFEHIASIDSVRHLLASRIADFEKDGIGLHMDRLNSVGVLQGFYVGQLYQVVLDLPFAALYFLAIAFVGGKIVLFPLLVALLMLLVVGYARVRFQQARIQQISVNDRRYNFIVEMLSGIHLVKAQAMEEQMLRRYERLQSSAAMANMDASFWGTVPAIAGATLALLTMFGTMTMGAAEVIAGDLTIGGLSASVLLAGRALQPVQSAIGLWFRYADTAIARNRIDQLANIPRESQAGVPAFPAEIEGAVELHKVSFRYGEVMPWILRDLSLRIPPGLIVAITSRGAAGTTTLLNLIMGNLRPESGRIQIDDYNIGEWEISDLRGRIDYVPANGALFKGTIVDNITMFKPEKAEAALIAAGMLGLDEPVGLLPLGYETVVDSQSGNFLPTGVVQRICLARVLVVKPRILLFDKTSATMDRESEEIFVWLLKRLKGRCTIVMVTNEPHLLDVADETYHLANGGLSRLAPGEANLRPGLTATKVVEMVNVG